MVCSIIRSFKQFISDGCPNCEEILQLRGNADAISECTSSLFEGVITLGDPKGSWVAKWLRLSEYEPGMYAVKVTGVLPEDVIEALEGNGIKYVPRDGGELEEERGEERE